MYLLYIRYDVFGGIVEEVKKSWDLEVYERYDHKCASCGTTELLKPQLIVPESRGGQRVITNGVLLCRACTVAKTTQGTALSGLKGNARPVNLWVSRELFTRLDAYVRQAAARQRGLTSRSALLRTIIEEYAANGDRYLELLIEEPNDVRINFWVDDELYLKFQSRATSEGLTVAGALRSLLVVYLTELEPFIKGVEL